MGIKFAKPAKVIAKAKAEEAEVEQEEVAAPAKKTTVAKKAAATTEAPSKKKLMGTASASVTGVKKNHKTGEEEVVEDSIEQVATGIQFEPVQATIMPKISFGMGFKKNKGDFNSINYNVNITLSVPEDEIEEGYSVAQQWVEKKIEELFEAC